MCDATCATRGPARRLCCRAGAGRRALGAEAGQGREGQPTARSQGHAQGAAVIAMSPARVVLTAELVGGAERLRGVLLPHRRMGMGRRHPVGVDRATARRTKPASRRSSGASPSSTSFAPALPRHVPPEAPRQVDRRGDASNSGPAGPARTAVQFRPSRPTTEQSIRPAADSPAIFPRKLRPIDAFRSWHELGLYDRRRASSILELLGPACDR